MVEQQQLFTTFLGTLIAFVPPIFGGIVVYYYIKNQEKKKIIDLLDNDCTLNWRNIEWNELTPPECGKGGLINYKNLNVPFKGIPQYQFSISTLKLFESEGANITKHLNRKQSKMFWELFNLLYDLESTRLFLVKADPNDEDYFSFQECFVILSKKSKDLYLKLLADIQNIKEK